MEGGRECTDGKCLVSLTGRFKQETGAADSKAHRDGGGAAKPQPAAACPPNQFKVLGRDGEGLHTALRACVELEGGQAGNAQVAP